MEHTTFQPDTLRHQPNIPERIGRFVTRISHRLKGHDKVSIASYIDTQKPHEMRRRGTVAVIGTVAVGLIVAGTAVWIRTMERGANDTLDDLQEQRELCIDDIPAGIPDATRAQRVDDCKAIGVPTP